MLDNGTLSWRQRASSTTKYLTATANKLLRRLGGTPDDHTRPVIPQEGSHLLQLPKELRLMILDFLFGDDDVFSKSVDNVDRASTPLRDPPIGVVCRLLREESLPMHYSRRIFTYNISRPATYLEMNRWVTRNPDALQKLAMARRVTFRGRTICADSLDDYWEITVDFQCLMILRRGYFDRWKDDDDGSNPRTSLVLILARRAILNAQFTANIEQALLDTLFAPDCGRSERSAAGLAFVEILRVCPGVFRIPARDHLRLRLARRHVRDRRLGTRDVLCYEAGT